MCKTKLILESVTFDVYIPRTQSKVWLMDINPWAQRTDPLLFSWLEILTLDETKIEIPELRFVNKDDPEAYCFNTPQYSAHKLPKEVNPTQPPSTITSHNHPLHKKNTPPY